MTKPLESEKEVAQGIKLDGITKIDEFDTEVITFFT